VSLHPAANAPSDASNIWRRVNFLDNDSTFSSLLILGVCGDDKVGISLMWSALAENIKRPITSLWDSVTRSAKKLSDKWGCGVQF
jgi:hypothetical protein